MDSYWVLFNPLTSSLLNMVFGIVLVIGVGILILNLVKLATSSYQRTGPAIGIILSLIIIGLSVT